MASQRVSLLTLLVAVLALSSLQASASAQASKVLLIGVSGLGSAFFDPSSNTTLGSLIDAGSSTMSARAALPTYSKPNWASVLKGAGPEEHGVASDQWYYRNTCVNYGVLDQQCVACATCNTIVDVAQGALENDPRLGNLTENALESALHSLCDELKFPLKQTCNTLVTTLAADIFDALVLGQDPEAICSELSKCYTALTPSTGADTLFPSLFGAIKDFDPSLTTAFYTDSEIVVNLLEKGVIDQFACMPGQTENLVNRLVNLVANEQPDVTFMHFDSVQTAGQQYGYGSSQYDSALASVDAYIGQIVGAYQSAGIDGETVIMVVGDHGGNRTSDGKVDMADLEVPWIVSGAGIKQSQVSDYVRGLDTASTLLTALSVPQPSAWIGHPIDVFSSGLDSDSQVVSVSASSAVVVTVSGLTSAGLSAAVTPTLDSLMRNGSYTLESRAVMPSTSLSNIASILMGAGPEEHGVCDGHTKGLQCTWAPPPAFSSITPITGAGALFPSIFDVVTDSGMTAATFYTSPEVAGLFNNDTLTSATQSSSDSDALTAAAQYLGNPGADFMFIQLQSVEDAANKHGYNSTQYLEAIGDVDGYLATFLSSIGGANAVIIVNSDHGGVRFEDGETNDESVLVPWIAYAPGTIVQGQEVASTIRGLDTASTLAMGVLGLQQPSVWIGQSITEVFV